MKVLLADPDHLLANQTLEAWDLDDASLMSVTLEDDVIAAAEEGPFDCVFLSTDFLTINGLGAISYFKEHSPGAEILILCDSKSLELAESALSKGAHSYLMKPVGSGLILESARKALTRAQNRANYRLMEDHVLEDLLGQTPAMKKILKTIYKVAPTTSTILITGESGTGKEFVSNIIHRLSKRSEESFIAVNSGAIPESIVESELFGTKKGAFTGAVADKKGLFEEAERGTLFLDEVGELPPQTQVKLLRFLENHEIRRVGDTENRKLDVRIIAATNVNMAEATQNGAFREDLFYRLNTFQLHLPPLRERKATIPNLVKFFVLKFNQEHEKDIGGIEPSAQFALTDYDYPGNIRELSNIVEHAVVMSENGQIRSEDLPEKMTLRPDRPALPDYSSETPIELHEEDGDRLNAHQALSGTSRGDQEEYNADNLPSLSDIEKKHIIQALRVLKNNQTEVAKRLGISRSTLWRKIQEHEIEM